MASENQLSNAKLFRALHANGVVVLPNAWDAVSAALIARAGALAIATTSGGIAWSLGHSDGESLSRDEMIAQIERIVDAVELPVTADIEGGYGASAENVAKTVAAAIDVGAVGINLEDSNSANGSLFDIPEQKERIRAAREIADRKELSELWINARTDVYLFGIGEPSERLGNVLTRASAYAEAGADSLFVPGLLDIETVAKIVKESPLPINVMVGVGAPPISEFAAHGVRRVSVGTSLTQAAYSYVERGAAELLNKGTYTSLGDGLDFGTLNSLFNGKSS